MAKKKTHQEAVAELALKGFRFAENTRYENAKTPILAICPNGHQRRVLIGSIRNTKYGCEECANVKRGKERVLSREKVERELQERGFRLREDEVYRGTDTPMFVVCLAGHTTMRTLSNIRSGTGCSECWRARRPAIAESYRMTQVFAEELALTYGYTFREKAKYVRYCDRIPMTCPMGHECHVSIASLVRGQGCYTCGRHRTTVAQRHSQEHVARVVQDWGLTLIPGQEYGNWLTVLSVRCQQGHIFERTFNGLQASQACPVCWLLFRQSRGEKSIEEVLIAAGLRYKRQIRFHDCRNKLPLPFDFGVYSANSDLLGLVEYNGEQHYRPIHTWGGERSFKDLVRRDGIKKAYCQKSGIPLLVVPYHVDDVAKVVSTWLTESLRLS